MPDSIVEPKLWNCEARRFHSLVHIRPSFREHTLYEGLANLIFDDAEFD